MDKKDGTTPREKVVDLMKGLEINEGQEIRISVGTQLVLISPEEEIFALRSRKRGELQLPGETAKVEDFKSLINSFPSISFHSEKGKEDDMRLYLQGWTYRDIEDMLTRLQATDSGVLISNAQRGILEELCNERETAVNEQNKKKLPVLVQEAFYEAYILPKPFLYLYDSKGVVSLGIQFGVVVRAEGSELFDILDTLSGEGKGSILETYQIADLKFGSDIAATALRERIE